MRGKGEPKEAIGRRLRNQDRMKLAVEAYSCKIPKGLIPVHTANADGSGGSVLS
jgi:hypothetical protein